MIIKLKDAHTSKCSWKILIEDRGTSGNEALEKEWLSVAVEIFKVFQTKQSDYGASNVSDMGFKGLITRMNDKMARLKQLTSREAVPVHESLQDTLIDLADYGIISLIEQRGLWPSSKVAQNENYSSERYDLLLAEVENLLHHASVSKKDINDLIRKYSPEKAIEKL